MKPDHLSFTAIAKKVGERWQDLTAEEREPFELEASTAKEKYHAEMAEYKTTKSYREYQQYLAEFKAKNFSVSGTRSIHGGLVLKLKCIQRANGPNWSRKRAQQAAEAWEARLSVKILPIMVLTRGKGGSNL